MRDRTFVFAAATVLALLLAACGNAPNDEVSAGEGGQAAGTVEVDGSSTVAPITDAVAEEYAAENPEVMVEVGVSGTGGGFERFCRGETDISNASREIKAEEVELCEESGVEFVDLLVGVDALTMVTNPQTDFVDCLTTAEVAKIFGPDDPAETWEDVRAGLPDSDLAVFAPGTDSGTYDFMVEDVLGLESSRQDYNASEQDNIIAQGVQGTPGSWGFFGFAYYAENAESLKAIAYDAGAGCVEPSLETAQDGSYEMTRPLYIYVNQDSLQDPAVADFVEFYAQNIDPLVADVGYVPLPEEELQETQSRLQEALSG